MTRLIYADALTDDILKSAVMIDDRGIQTGYEIAIELIKKQQTVDAVPVIRCKACRWFRNDDEGTWCVAWAGQNTNPDAFCSYAQPKERG